jgi:hypothetical protein
MIILFTLKIRQLYIGIILGLILAFSSGLRSDGYDYDNYMNMIDGVRYSKNLEGLIFAKDLFILGLLELVTKLTESDEYWPYFLILTLTGCVIKIVAFNAAQNNSANLWVVYIIFFSATLEFSAMRSSIAISFILLMLNERKNLIYNKYILGAFAAASHISLLPSVLVFLFQKRSFNSKILIFIFPIITLIINLLSEHILSLDRGKDYLGNFSTVYAWILPSGVLFSYALILISKKKLEIVDFLILFNFSIVFGILPYSVGVSHRYMEICMILILYTIFTCKINKSIKNSSLFILIFTGSTRMILNGAWSNLQIY